MFCWTYQPGQLPRDCFTLPETMTQGPRAWLSEVLQVSPLQSTPQPLTPSQALGQEEMQQCKSTKSDCPGTQAPVCPSGQTHHHKDQAGYLPCSWRTGKRHWRQPVASRLGWKAKSRNTAHNSFAMLFMAVSACLVRAGAAAFRFQHLSWVARGCSAGTTRGKMSCKKPCSRQQQSRAQLLAKAAADQLAAAAQGPPACPAAPKSQNRMGFFRGSTADAGVQMVNLCKGNVFRSSRTSPKVYPMGPGQKQRTGEPCHT